MSAALQSKLSPGPPGVSYTASPTPILAGRTAADPSRAFRIPPNDNPASAAPQSSGPPIGTGIETADISARQNTGGFSFPGGPQDDAAGHRTTMHGSEPNSARAPTQQHTPSRPVIMDGSLENSRADRRTVEIVSPRPVNPQSTVPHHSPLQSAPLEQLPNNTSAGIDMAGNLAGQARVSERYPQPQPYQQQYHQQHSQQQQQSAVRPQLTIAGGRGAGGMDVSDDDDNGRGNGGVGGVGGPFVPQQRSGNVSGGGGQNGLATTSIGAAYGSPMTAGRTQGHVGASAFNTAADRSPPPDLRSLEFAGNDDDDDAGGRNGKDDGDSNVFTSALRAATGAVTSVVSRRSLGERAAQCAQSISAQDMRAATAMVNEHPDLATYLGPLPVGDAADAADLQQRRAAAQRTTLLHLALAEGGIGLAARPQMTASYLGNVGGPSPGSAALSPPPDSVSPPLGRLVAALLRAGARPMAVDGEGLTAIDVALDHCPALAADLVTATAKNFPSDLQRRNPFTARALLHDLLSHPQGPTKNFRRLPIIEALITVHGVSATEEDGDGRAPLDHARDNFLKLGSEGDGIVTFLEAPPATVSLAATVQSRQRWELSSHPVVRLTTLIILATLQPILAYSDHLGRGTQDEFKTVSSVQLVTGPASATAASASTPGEVQTQLVNNAWVTRGYGDDQFALRGVARAMHFTTSRWPAPKPHPVLFTTKLLCLVIGLVLGLIAGVLVHRLILQGLFALQMFGAWRLPQCPCGNARKKQGTLSAVELKKLKRQQQSSNTSRRAGGGGVTFDDLADAGPNVANGGRRSDDDRSAAMSSRSRRTINDGAESGDEYMSDATSSSVGSEWAWVRDSRGSGGHHRPGDNNNGGGEPSTMGGGRVRFATNPLSPARNNAAQSGGGDAGILSQFAGGGGGGGGDVETSTVVSGDRAGRVAQAMSSLFVVRRRRAVKRLAKWRGVLPIVIIGVLCGLIAAGNVWNYILDVRFEERVDEFEALDTIPNLTIRNFVHIRFGVSSLFSLWTLIVTLDLILQMCEMPSRLPTPFYANFGTSSGLRQLWRFRGTVTAVMLIVSLVVTVFFAGPWHLIDDFWLPPWNFEDTSDTMLKTPHLAVNALLGGVASLLCVAALAQEWALPHMQTGEIVVEPLGIKLDLPVPPVGGGDNSASGTGGGGGGDDRSDERVSRTSGTASRAGSALAKGKTMAAAYFVLRARNATKITGTNIRGNLHWLSNVLLGVVLVSDWSYAVWYVYEIVTGAPGRPTTRYTDAEKSHQKIFEPTSKDFDAVLEAAYTTASFIPFLASVVMYFVYLYRTSLWRRGTYGATGAAAAAAAANAGLEGGVANTSDDGAAAGSAGLTSGAAAVLLFAASGDCYVLDDGTPVSVSSSSGAKSGDGQPGGKANARLAAARKAQQNSSAVATVWECALADDVIRLGALIDGDQSLLHARGGVGLRVLAVEADEPEFHVRSRAASQQRLAPWADHATSFVGEFPMPQRPALPFGGGGGIGGGGFYDGAQLDGSQTLPLPTAPPGAAGAAFTSPARARNPTAELCLMHDPTCAAAPLHYAVFAGARGAVAALLARGANVQQRTLSGLVTATELCEMVPDRGVGALLRQRSGGVPRIV